MSSSDDELPPEAVPLDAPAPAAPAAAPRSSQEAAQAAGSGGDGEAGGAAAVAVPPPAAPVPVTLITGFLGAGKTTLVRSTSLGLLCSRVCRSAGGLASFAAHPPPAHSLPCDKPLSLSPSLLLPLRSTTS